MIKESITLEEVINFLNELIKIDPNAMYDLIEQRVLCNYAMVEHPTVQVQDYEDTLFPCVGLVGILNGMFGVDKEGWGGISAVFDKDKLIKFQRTSEVNK